MVSETDGSLSAWGERSEDEALLSINRALLIHLLPSPLHQYATAEETWSQPDAEPPRRRLRRRLVENPAVFRAELPDDELDVLSRERNELARHLDENFGLVLEVRAEGVLAYDPSAGRRTHRPRLSRQRQRQAGRPAAARRAERGRAGRRTARSCVDGRALPALAGALAAGRRGADEPGRPVPDGVEGRLRASPSTALRADVVGLLHGAAAGPARWMTGWPSSRSRPGTSRR